MTSNVYPSTVMYTVLKELGLSHAKSARILLRTQTTFDGQPLARRIEDSSQLSRRIVHVAPGQIPRTLFEDFAASVPVLSSKLLGRFATAQPGATPEQAADAFIVQRLFGAHERMGRALSAEGGASAYANAAVCIGRLQLDSETDRVLLHLMLFVTAGCTGDAREAARIVEDYAASHLDVHFDTAETAISSVPESGTPDVELSLGLARIVSGKIKAGTQLYRLDPNGTELGLLPEGENAVSDVDSDVSRRHARIWREGGRWYIEGLQSTNGTLLVTGADRAEIIVEPPRALRSPDYTSQPVEINATDIICLGATTRFMVMPSLAE